MNIFKKPISISRTTRSLRPSPPSSPQKRGLSGQDKGLLKTNAQRLNNSNLTVSYDRLPKNSETVFLVKDRSDQQIVFKAR